MCIYTPDPQIPVPRRIKNRPSLEKYNQTRLYPPAPLHRVGAFLAVRELLGGFQDRALERRVNEALGGMSNL